MNRPTDWPRILVIVGLAALVIGAVDPLEGSLVILAGIGFVAFGAARGSSRQRFFLLWSFALVAVGVGALFGLSALGGVGGTSDRSKWWALVILPYPVGWVMGLIGAVRNLRGAR
jgi:hypothetical protein